MELLADDDHGWQRVGDLLADGHIVGVPTDTVYGVAAPVAAPAAVARLFPLKDRDLAKPLAVLVADIAQAATLVDIPPLAESLARRWWPGALTIVLARRRGVEVDLGGAGDTIGVRCPGHPRLVALCDRLGPLATTSANRSGRPTPNDAAGVVAELNGTEVRAVLDGGGLVGSASTVVRIVGDQLEVLRAGPISASDLAASSDRLS